MIVALNFKPNSQLEPLRSVHDARVADCFANCNKGSFTYYVISRGGGGVGFPNAYG